MFPLSVSIFTDTRSALASSFLTFLSDISEPFVKTAILVLRDFSISISLPKFKSSVGSPSGTKDK